MKIGDGAGKLGIIRLVCWGQFTNSLISRLRGKCLNARTVLRLRLRSFADKGKVEFSGKKAGMKAFLIIVLVGNLQAVSQRLIGNSISEINAKIGKISLKYLQTWGEEGKSGQVFKNPSDVVVDKENNIYISDSGLHCIKIFNKHGELLNQIGKRGQGPGDFISPEMIGLDANETLWVYDNSRRMQSFGKNGKAVSSCKLPFRPSPNLVLLDEMIALLDLESARDGKGIIKLLDKSCMENGAIGKSVLPPILDRPWAGGKYDNMKIACDKKTKSFLVIYPGSQMIQIFQNSSERSLYVSYDTHLNSLPLSWNDKRNNFELKKRPKEYSECSGIDVDDQGNVFIVISTRLQNDNEKMDWLFFKGGSMIVVPASKKYPKNTDMYRLLVFSRDGKIVAAKQLSFFCYGIYIIRDRIFFIDRVFDRVVREYQFRIEK